MALNIVLLENSFAAVAPRGQDLVEVFYRNLFADFPSVIPLFEGVDIVEQQKKLLMTLMMAVENLRRPEVLTPALEAMGSRHVDYGAREEHYPAVGATLLKSLATIAGPAWNEELARAWGEAYEAISGHMLHGAVAVV